MSVDDRQARPILLAGTVVVAFVLGCSRWGTYIGVAPFFISDVLIAIALFHNVSTIGVKGQRHLDVRSQGAPTLLFAAFFLYILLRFGLSFGQAEVLDWLRDGVPFVYGILAFISAHSLSSVNAEARTRTFRVLRWALNFHILWMAAVWALDMKNGLPLFSDQLSAPIFQIRPDIDAAILAIAIGVNVRAAYLEGRWLWNIVGAGLAVAILIFALPTRAGLLSLIVALLLTLILCMSATGNSRNRQLMLVAFIPLLALGGLSLLSLSESGQRLVASVAPELAANEQILGSTGTTNAREAVWSGVAQWTAQEPARLIFGSGFGNDFLSDSGTLGYLEGTTYDNVRSPHNWLIGILARTGLIGILLASLWLVQMLRIVVRYRADIGQDPLLFLAALTYFAILTVSLVGVVLEAPFGAIPFFWASGVLMSAVPTERLPHFGVNQTAGRRLLT